MKALLAVSLLAAIFVGCGRISHPSDATLIERFNMQRKQLEELVQMIQQDQLLTRVSVDFTVPENPETINVTPQRLEKYRQLLRAIQSPLGIEKPQSGTDVWFIVSGSGFGISGSGKGYLYSTNPPAPLLNDLDNYIPQDNISPAYRKITDNWYLWAD